MTTSIRVDPGVEQDEPRRLVENPPIADRIFKQGSRAVGLSVLVITGSIGVFLAIQSVPDAS